MAATLPPQPTLRCSVVEHQVLLDHKLDAVAPARTGRVVFLHMFEACPENTS